MIASSLLICLLCCSFLLNSLSVSSASAFLEGMFTTPAAMITGDLYIQWGDQAPEDGAASLALFQLHDPTSDRFYTLKFGSKLPLPYEELVRYRGLPVQVSGWHANNLQSEDGADQFQVAAIQPLKNAPQFKTASTTLAVTGEKPFVSLMCKFSDISSEPQNLAYFQNMYAAAYPGLDHYWRQASGGLMNIAGSSAYGWYTLPSPRSAYIANNRLDFLKIASDCTALADPHVDFRTVHGINLMFNGNLDGYAWGGGLWMTLDGVARFWPMTWEPPWGYQHVTAIAHEMGHAFGLPHSSGMYGLTYDNRWDVMSDTWTDCVNLMDAVYGCLGQGTIGYHLDRLGWIPANRLVNLSPGTNGTFNLVRLHQPPESGLMLLKVNVPGVSTRYFTVEVRRKAGYDQKLPREGVVIHEVVTTRERPAQVVDADNNGNTGDEGAVWSQGETFVDQTSGISIKMTGISGGVYTVEVAYPAAGSPTPTRPPTTALTPTLMVIYSNRSFLPAIQK